MRSGGKTENPIGKGRKEITMVDTYVMIRFTKEEKNFSKPTLA